jgi:hypothetical protein
LFRIGHVHDLSSLSAAYTSASLCGLQPRGVLAHGRRLLVERANGAFVQWPHAERCEHQQKGDADPGISTR